jgi:hypothetical protein
MADRPPFLRTAPVHFGFLRTLDELEASAQNTEESTDKASPPYGEERRTWHMPSLSGGQQAEGRESRRP